MIEAHNTLKTENVSAHEDHRTSRAQIALAWTVVSIPLLWGILQTLEKAMALFQ